MRKAMNLSRRGLIGSFLASPPIIRPGLLMPVKSRWITPCERAGWFTESYLDRIAAIYGVYRAPAEPDPALLRRLEFFASIPVGVLP